LADFIVEDFLPFHGVAEHEYLLCILCHFVKPLSSHPSP
jgi:hypothetical protein